MNRKAFFKSLLVMIGLGALCKSKAADSLEGWTVEIEVGEGYDLTQPTNEEWDFYRGKQWPKDILEARTKLNRPCLTINRIPEFVYTMVAEQRQGLNREITAEERGAIVARVVREKRDEQMLLNYMASTRAEFEANLRA